MKLIRNWGRRRAKIGSNRLVKVGLYYCPDCCDEVVLPVLFARGKSGCGCLEKAYKRTSYRPKPDARTCLMCGKKFASRGTHNRRCRLCEHKLANDGQAYYCPPVYKQRDYSVAAYCGKD
mgnify:CR=1 FL=1